MLPKMAMLAFGARSYDESKTWAAKALASVETLEPKNMHGEAINAAHTVYGRLALLEGDIEAAKRHLLASAQTPGSMRLNNFGPNLRLAELLAKLSPVDLVLVEGFKRDAHQKIEVHRSKNNLPGLCFFHWCHLSIKPHQI